MSKKIILPDTVKDHFKSGENFALKKHPDFEIWVTSPQPPEDKIESYYDTEDYISHSDAKKGLFQFLYQTVKSYALRNKVRHIATLNKGAGSILDIGAGTGAFLEQAKLKGWNVQGVEVSKKARELAALKNLKLSSSLDGFTGEQFDVVTLWHVLEHLDDLEQTVAKIEKLVAPNGHLIIAVPNYKSYDAQYYKEFWAAYDVPRHLWHFSQKGIRQLISNSFDLVSTKPMIFDAYYVSLLSEKYKNNNSFSLKAIYRGWKSNWKAKTSREYSSLLYSFKKQQL